MSALPQFVRAPREIAAVLLGTGVVGGALLRLLASPSSSRIHLVGVANSKRQVADADGVVANASELDRSIAHRDDAALLDALDRSGASRRVIIDATASRETAARHAAWLAASYEVVTANKDAAAASLGAWRTLDDASSKTRYGDSATVGAGLPVLSTIRRLRAAGDSIVAIEGVFSGSLSWLFNQYDGSRPFSALVREARAWGYTEPDPRLDLGGVDVARKLVILARAAGRAIEVGDVCVESLVPDALRSVDASGFLADIEAIDAPIAARFAEATAQGCVLRHLASIDAGGAARVGLVAVDASHPAARLSGADNLFALTTQRYRARPLVIQGPGAGAEVTAQALLADVLERG